MGNEITYNVDIVFCIDTTGSMKALLDKVKEHALGLYDDIEKTMTKKGKVISSLRTRVIAFRDYIADGDMAMLETGFFDLPAQREQFSECVHSLTHQGGGDEPEDGLEALAYAIKSDWNDTGMKKRHIIVVYTDASTHELGYGASAPEYPTTGMARDFDELTSWWGDGQYPGLMNQNAKRLLMFAPEADYWSTIYDNWTNAVYYPSKAGEGLADIDYEEILNEICNSI